MSKILDIPAVETFNCNTDDNLTSDWEKWKKRFQYYVAAAGLSDNKQKREVLLHLIGPAGQEIFDTFSDTGDNYESAIASLDNYFMPKKNLIYEHYNFLSARQNSAKTIDAYVTHLRLLTNSCDYGGFEEKMVRDHQASKMESFQQHDDSIMVIVFLFLKILKIIFCKYTYQIFTFILIILVSLVRAKSGDFWDTYELHRRFVY